MAAYQSGKISARRAAQLLYLQPDQQRAELTRLLSIQEEAARRSRIAAEARWFKKPGCSESRR
jgi:hypothetical protein